MNGEKMAQSERELLEYVLEELRRLRTKIETPVQGMTQEQVARRLNISKRLFFDIVRSGLISYSLVGQKKRFRPSDVEDYLERMKPASSSRKPKAGGQRTAKERGDAIRAMAKSKR